MQAIFGPKAAWSTTEYLLAGILDAENISIWQRAGDKKVPRPQPLDRPGDIAERPAGVSLAERHRRLLERARTKEVTDGS